MERWKEIKGYEDRYKVSNYGRVWSKKHKKIMKQSITPQYSEYPWIGLIDDDGKIKSWFVHRLVALHFVKNDDTDNKTIINHIDENKQNARWDNLEWCTTEYNLNYSNTRASRCKKVIYRGVEYKSITEFCLKNSLEYYSAMKILKEESEVA